MIIIEPNNNYHVPKKRLVCCEELAKQEVQGFSIAYDRYQRAFIGAGFSASTCANYLRGLSQISLFYRKCFHLLDDEEISNYLCHLHRQKASYSKIKFILYGFRFLFKIMKATDRKIEYRGKPTKVALPVVLNQQEIKLILHPCNCPNLKHRIILSLLYSSGLRISELQKLKISDVDFEARRLYIRCSKNGVSRYVVLSQLIAKGLKQYLTIYDPKLYLINGALRGKPYLQVICSKSIKQVTSTCRIK